MIYSVTCESPNQMLNPNVQQVGMHILLNGLLEGRKSSKDSVVSSAAKEEQGNKTAYLQS